jgi:signal transduction histidine kinase
MAPQNMPPGISSTFHLPGGVVAYLKLHWIILARIAWAVAALLALGLLIASLPSYFTYLHTLNMSGTTDTRLGPIGQLTTSGLQQYQALGLSLDFYAWYLITLRTVFLLIFATVGGMLFWRTMGKPIESVALIASAFLILFPATFSQAPFVLLPAIWALLINTIYFLGNTCLGLFFYLFPNGRPVPRWTGWLIVAWVGYWFVDTFFAASQINLYAWILFALFLLGLGSLVWVQVYRYRRVSLPDERRQTKWLVFGVVISFGGTFVIEGILGLFPLFFPHLPLPFYLLGYTFLNLFLCLFPIFLAIAVLCSHLWDIDIIINRTLVYGILTVSTVSIYVLVVISLGALLRAEGNPLISLLATGLIAVLFQPLRLRLQWGVNRLMYGERDNPYHVISRLGQRLEKTLAPEAALPMIVETVAQALKLPYAAISMKQGDEFIIAASYGKPGEIALTLPLVYQAESIGQLLLAPRARGEGFTPADRRLLDDLARQAGIAAHAVQLTIELQQARERLVTAREEERRRLRRDLHDGLGPTLAALNLQAGAVRALIPQDPLAADALVAEWRTTLRAVIADIRRLVYELRPPALDELGLIGAIREQAAQYSTDAGSNGVQMTVEAPDQPPCLPAAIEVAAYRIAQEAFANVAGHAQAHLCRTRLWLDNALYLEITDDGIGLPEGHRAGVGLLSMRERVEELGGSCSIGPAIGGGTRVYIRLPLAKE